MSVALLLGSPTSEEPQVSIQLVEGRDLYVAPDGAGTNPGTKELPLALGVALSDVSPARPGDTLWLRGGTYHGAFVSALRGHRGAPIRVRGFPGETAVIDTAPSPKPALSVVGSWTVFQGFEITNSDPKRRSMETGPWPSDLHRGGGVFTRGAQNQFINLVIHDMADGLGIWSESQGSMAYGNIVFNNGWAGPDRSHGHGIYTQNEIGTREIAENIVFNQFSHGIHAYGSAAAFLDQIVLRGNVAFNNGLLGTNGPERDILLGGGRRAVNPVLEENATYGPAQNNLGYAAGCTDGVVSRNYFVGSTPLLLVACEPVVANNFLLGLLGSLPQSYPDNFYFTEPPSGVVTLVRPNRYEAGRAHVIVYNWDKRRTIEFDPSRLLEDRDTYEVRDVQYYAGPPVATGLHRAGSLISIDLGGLQAGPAIGDVPVAPKHTAPEFAVFVLRRTSVSASH